MAKMGRGSRSFLRYRENAEFLGEVIYMQDENKRHILDFMHRFEYNDRSVYFAENLQTMTAGQIQTELRELGAKLHHAGANGVLEFHPTADGTSKSAHIHYWGKLTDDVEYIITDHIKQNRLSNKTYLNYTNEEMGRDREHKIVNGKLVEYAFDRSRDEITRETIRSVDIDEDQIAIGNAAHKESTYDDIIAYCDDILSQLGEEETAEADYSADRDEIDMDAINAYIMELEYDLYE